MKKKKHAADKRRAQEQKWEKRIEKKMTAEDNNGEQTEVTIDIDQEFPDTDWTPVRDTVLEAKALEKARQEYYNKAEIIDEIKNNKDTSIESMTNIHNMINNYYAFTQEEIDAIELLTLSAEHGNLLSMKQLASVYKNEEFPRESEPEYLHWLNRIVSDKRVQEYIAARENNQDQEKLSSISNNYLSFIAGAASYELGLFYRNSQKLDEIKKALSFISAAEICGYPFYPGPHVTHEIKLELLDRIKSLEKYIKNKQIEGNLINLLENISIDTMSVDEQISKLRNNLRAEIGDDIWDAFQEETRICLVTSISCFYYLLHATTNEARLDFSCVIIPLMKTLEHELKIRFYNGYIDYLKGKHYNIDKYIRLNNIDNIRKGYDRGGIILTTRSGKKDYSDYIRYPNKYTLGSFIYSTGLLSLKREIGEDGKVADQTMIDYCQECLLRERLPNDEKVDSWLYELATHIEKIRDERNDSAHGGNIMNSFSANEALNYLVLIKKILVNLVKVCRQI